MGEDFYALPHGSQKSSCWLSHQSNAWVLPTSVEFSSSYAARYSKDIAPKQDMVVPVNHCTHATSLAVHRGPV